MRASSLLASALSGLLLVAGAVLASAPAVPDDPGMPEERAAALESVKRFLVLVDHRNEQMAWPEVGSIMKEATGSLEDWQANLSAMQADLGLVESRQLLEMGFTDGLGDIPEGRYYVLHYSTKFARASAMEEIMVVFEHGEWRIAGYIVSSISRQTLPAARDR